MITEPIFGSYGLFYELLLGLCLLVYLIAGWKIYERMGLPGWTYLIPIYNIVVLLNTLRKPMLWLLWILLPVIPCAIFYALLFGYAYVNIFVAILSGITFLVSVFFSIRLLYAWCKSFGAGVGFTVGMILLPVVFQVLLAFGKQTFTPPPVKTNDLTHPKMPEVPIVSA